MILLDLQQTILASYAIAMSTGPKHGPGALEVDINIFRHIALNTIKTINRRFRSEYGELVLAIDSKDVWRKEVFPYYKANRKKARDNSLIDWTKVFAVLDQLKDEIRDNMPYRFVKVDGCEADDVIAVLARSAQEATVIVSGDHDFVQLHRTIPPVHQWDHVRKRVIQYDENSLKRKIIRGDAGDGVPNFLSDDDTFVMPDKRQKAITVVKETEWLQLKPEDIWKQTKDPATAERNWLRNETMVDLNLIPSNLVKGILDKYAESPKVDRTSVYSYFATCGLKKLLEDVQDF